VTASDSGTGSSGTYSYDGDGRRVQRVVNGVTTVYVYDAFGQLATEYSTAPQTAGTRYLVTDPLGSVRMVSDGAGTPVSTHDYLPFGEEIPAGWTTRGPVYGAPDGVSQRFTSMERDAEAGLDFFGARYFSGAQGRFTSPDQPMNDQDPGDSQSWNLFSYVRNNPFMFADPTGRECVTLDSGAKGDDGQGKMCNDPSLNTTHGVTVGVGRDEANLIMLEGIGQKLSSPTQLAEVAKNGMEGAATLDAILSLPSLFRSGWGAIKALREARDAARLANLMNILRQAARGKGNFGLGNATAEEAETLGKVWVGDGAKVASDGKTLVSADGLKQYRPPSFKPNLGQTQANFESRWTPGGQWQTNGHLDIH
jgi:RHS repeat-associated protein